MLYGAIPGQATRQIRDLFEKGYGLKVNNWRGGPDDILNRIAGESKSGGVLSSTWSWETTRSWRRSINKDCSNRSIPPPPADISGPFSTRSAG